MIWVLVAIMAVVVGARAMFLRSWQAAARRLGLTLSEGTIGGAWSLHGTIRGCRVSVTSRSNRGRRDGQVVLTVVPPRAIPVDLDLAREAAIAPRLLAPNDLTFGDASFDKHVRVQGRETTVYGLLNHETRALVEKFVYLGGRVEAGELVVDVYRLASLDERLALAVELALRLQAPGEGLTRALMAGLVHDPVPTARRKCLELLLKIGGETAEQAREVAARDRDPEILLAAADAGADAERLQRLALAPPIPASVAERALLRLVEVDIEVAADTVRQVLAGAVRGHTARAIELVAHLELADQGPRMLRLARHPDPQVAQAAVATLVALREAGAEEVLVGLLTHTSREVRQAAAEGLGAVGSLEAVPALAAAEADDQVPSRVARAAIAGIQARLARGEAGGLALSSEPDRGGLAVVEQGQLAMAEALRGRQPATAQKEREFGAE